MIHIILFYISFAAPIGRSKATRQDSRSLDLDRLITANGGNPLPMIFDKEGGTWRAVGEHHAKFNNWIGQQTRDFVPPYYPSWDRVPSALKDRIIRGVQVCNTIL